LGYIAFQIEFVREGAAFGLVSIPALANLARNALELLGVTAGSVLGKALTLINVPDFVSSIARNALGEGLAALDVIRETFPVAPAASLAARNEIEALIVDVAGLSPDRVADFAPRAFAVVQTVADNLPAASAIRAMRQLSEQFEAVPALPSLSPLYAVQARNVAAASSFIRAAALAAETEAVIRSDYVARPDGVRARAEIAMRYEAAMLLANGAEHADLYRALDDARGRAIEYLSKVINDLAPVISVASGRVMPSLYWSYRLYAEAARGTELAQRNSVRNPAFMPKEFSALAR
jgi:prophage DNA circulation protein